VIIDVKVEAPKKDEESKDEKSYEPEFLYEKQMLFLDETQNFLCWFTWKDRKLHLNELDLTAYNYDTIDKISKLPETKTTLI
jgi:hypothetical protein